MDLKKLYIILCLASLAVIAIAVDAPRSEEVTTTSPVPDNSTEDTQLDMITTEFNSTLNESSPSTKTKPRKRPPGISSYFEYKLSLTMYGVYPIIFVTIGTVGNVLSIIVLSRKSMRTSSSCVFMFALAILDTLALWSIMFGMLQRVYVRTLPSLWFCRMLFFFQNVATTMASWILICMTVERFIAIYFPLHAGKMCTVKRARMTICVLLVFIMLMAMHDFWTGVHIPTSNLCTHATKKYPILLNAMNYIEALMGCFIPEITLLIINPLIVYRLKVTQAQQKYMTNTAATGTTNKASNQSKQITRMLLTVTFTYCVLMTPYATFYVSRTYWVDRTKPYTRAVAFLVQQVSMICIMLNHSINFFLYFVSGRRFRNELKSLLCGKAVTKSTTSTGSTAFTKDSTVSTTDASVVRTTSTNF